MKKIFQLTTLLAMALVVFSCTKTEVSTDQYDGAVVALKAYGPQPVVRGGILRFVGSNLDKVVTVTLPGVDPITPEVVTAGVHSEIRVTVPKDGPDVGYPVLNLADGTTITGKTQLTYSEPIIIDEVTPLSVYPGDKITLTGDYLNTLHEVIFTSDVKVSEDDFVEHTRYKIVVEVPEEAQTGMLAVGTVDESKLEDGDNALASLNIMELEEITVGTATGTFPEAPVKAGSEVAISGSRLLLVEGIMIGLSYEVPEFEATNSKIAFTLAEDAPDGEVSLIMASGVAVPIGTLTTVAPSELVVSPNPVKAGASLKVTGKDLDLVKSVVAGGADIAEFTCTAEGTEISFTVPGTAVDGDVVFTMANGKQVSVPFTLVAPVITAVAPSPIPAGSDLTITGTDLDLVKAVNIDDQEMKFEVVSATEITVKTEAATLGGKLTLTTANGTTVAFDEDIVFDYGSVTQVTALTEKAAPGETVTMTGSGFNAIEAIYIGEVKVTSYSKREDTEMVFLMPEVEPGTYAPAFHLTTGETESPAGFSITYEDEDAPVVNVIWKGNVLIDWNNPKVEGAEGAMSDLAYGEFDWSEVAPGTTLNIHYTQYTEKDYWQLRLGNGSWTALPGTSDVNLEAGSTLYSIVLTKDMLDELVANGGLVITGAFIYVNQVELVTYPVKERVIWEGNTDLGAWSGNVQLMVADIGELPSGSTLCITYSGSGEYPQFKLVDMTWAILPTFATVANEWGVVDVSAEGGTYEYPLSDADINAILTVEAGWGGRGLVVSGQNAIVTKISIK